MIYRELCGENISALGFGAMRLPVIDGDDAKIDCAKAEEMVDYAYEHGINYFDSAWTYHGGNSESFMAKVLSKYPRESYFITSKFPGFIPELAGKVEEVFEEQLRKTGLEYFDFYLVHNVVEVDIDTYLNPNSGIVPYLIEQKKKGRIRHLGFSAHGSAETIQRFLETYGDEMEFCQLQVNWVDWKYQHADKKVELLRKYKLPLWIMEPLRGGRLANLKEEEIAPLKALRPNESAAGWAFRFLQSIDIAGVTLTGASSLEQLAENIAVWEEDKPLSDEEMNVLLSLAETLSKGVPCTGCKYCVSQCPKVLDIPRLIALYNDDKISNGWRITGLFLKFLPEYTQPSCCIHCGKCTEVCPQGIKIPDILAELAEWKG